MRVLNRLFVILFVSMAMSVSASAQENQDNLDALLRRLTEIEAEQAKSQETIRALRSEIEALRTETEVLRTESEQRAKAISASADTASKESPKISVKLEAHPTFPELANESQFVFKSEDGDFSLGIDGTIIGRYEVNHREDDGTGSSDTDQGFEMTGTRINFKGTLYEDYGYWVRFNGDDFGDPSFDAVAGLWHPNENMTVGAGQFSSTLTREQGIPADRLQVAESSPTNYTFDPFGYKGVIVGYHTPKMVYRGVINDGYRSSNNAFFDEPSAKWAFAGQVSGMVIGDEDDWDRFNNFTSRPDSDLAWMVNGAFHVQEGDSHGSGGIGSNDMYLGILESSLEGDGWNLYASAYYRHTDLEDTLGIKADDFGFVIEGGAWISKHYEMYSRFDITIPDSDRPVEDDEFKTLTAGLNYYPFPHTDNLRLNTEMLYMFDSEADSIVEPNIFSSVRDSPEGDQVVWRSSFVIRW